MKRASYFTRPLHSVVSPATWSFTLLLKNKTSLAGILALFTLFSGGCEQQAKKETTLNDAFAGKFYIGTALNADQITGKDTAAVNLIRHQFNAIVAENCMKSEQIQPREGEFDFSLADQFVSFGEQNNMWITGHTLIWHSQSPRWFFTDSTGNDVSREVMIERMRTHIHTLVGAI